MKSFDSEFHRQFLTRYSLHSLLFFFLSKYWSSACVCDVKEQEVIDLCFDLLNFINFHSTWKDLFFSIWEYTEAAGQACPPLFRETEARSDGDAPWLAGSRAHVTLWLAFSTLLPMSSKCLTLSSDITLKGRSFCQCILFICFYFMGECSCWLFIYELDCM